jgi:hypothetical protein
MTAACSKFFGSAEPSTGQSLHGSQAGSSALDATITERAVPGTIDAA